MLPYFDEIFGNASSNHVYGKQAKQAVDNARENVAKIINAKAKEIVFTSGATEAINLGIKGFEACGHTYASKSFVKPRTLGKFHGR